ncbi:hypothetical protein HFU84_06710, partial [Acidithiobacillus sp. CV18-2]|nr:hypothetical protein [Acidithiobacillus sp. CV18-2]
ESARSGPEGMTLADLERLAGEAGLTLQAFRRIDAQAEIPVPSVVHWQVGHFGTLLAFQNGKYLLRDSVYPQERWIHEDILHQEGSGYFLLPEAVPGFEGLDTAQKALCAGRGHVSGKRALTPKSQKIKNPTCKHKDGMATYNAFASTVALTIDDQPWSYTPPKGPAVAFRLAYNQRDTQQPANFSFSNVGH